MNICLTLPPQFQTKRSSLRPASWTKTGCFFGLVLCSTLSSQALSKSCGSIVKDGVKHNIPCSLATTNTSAQTATGNCSASITVNGKTTTYNQHCRSNTTSAPATIREPAGAFKTRQNSHKALINSLAQQYGIDSALIHAVISVESAYRREAVSHKGAMGLMQLMPLTAAELNVSDSFDAQANIDGGIRYLQKMINRFNGNIKLGLAAYNAGAESVKRYNNAIPPYPETQRYVQQVLNYRDRYRNDWQQHIQ